MSERPAGPLRGKALLEFLQSLSHLSHRDRAKKCGYYTIVLTSDGQQKIRINLSDFYDAILEARAQEKQSQYNQNTRDRFLTLDHQHQPKEFDAVLGGQAAPPFEGVVLGGLEGVKHRLRSSNVEARVAALSEALNYGEAGLDLVIAALKESSKLVQGSAFQLLRSRTEKKVKQVLSDCDPSLLFTTLHNWNIENFNPRVGVTDPLGTAYVVNIEQFKLLLQDPLASKITALVWQMPSYDWSQTRQFRYVVDALFDAHEHLTNLKALCIGNSVIPIGDVGAILKVYPSLEVLQIRAGNALDFSNQRHDNLKVLIVETINSSQTIVQLGNLELPALEYLDVCENEEYGNGKSEPTVLTPILSGKLFPNLKYLGLRNINYSDKIAYALVRSLIVHRLLALDLSDGTLGDKGAEALLNCSVINRLHTLNLSRNYLSKEMVQRLSYLRCRVIAKSQKSRYYHRYNSVWE